MENHAFSSISPVRPRGAEHCSDRDGLDHDIKPWDLLRLVRDVGHVAGLTGGDIQHLDYLISHTREVDWEAGERPVVYKSVCVMARERGVSERQIWNREHRLHSLGCLVWNDMGNFRRTGGRDRDGRIAFAYGVDLSPLAKRYDEFLALKQQQTRDLARFNEARRQVSAVRRRCVIKIAQAQEQALPVCDLVERLGDLPRVHARLSPATLEGVLTMLEEIEAALDGVLSEPRKTCAWTQNTSDQSEDNFRHIQPTNNPQSANADTCNGDVPSRPGAGACQPMDDDREAGCKEPGSPDTCGQLRAAGHRADAGEEADPSDAIRQGTGTGAEHITIRTAIDAASDEFISLIVPTGRRLRMSDLVDAAASRCHGLGIHRSAWADACSVMGRSAAAIAVIVIDRNLDHPQCPVIRPGGVLRSLTARARTGELHLHRSIFGILGRDGTGGAS